jgi:hypothetical protein
MLVRRLLWAIMIALAIPSGAQAQCGPHTAPAQAATVGFNCETFFDGPWSLATIDINNTKGAGFKWYTDMTWPQSTFYSSPVSAWRNLGTNSPGDFSISGGDLVFAPQAPVTFDGGIHAGNIMTCTAIADPPYYRGTTFSGGAYFEVLATWPNGTAHGSEPSWPNAWTMAIKFLTGTGVLPFNFSEMDIFESAFGRNFHQWEIDGVTLIDHASNCGACGIPPSGVKYGFLVVPGALNGGTPKVDYYANDAFVATSAPPSPYTQAVFETAAADPTCLILGTAQSNPMTVQTVRVWQQQPPPQSGGRIPLMRR